MIMCFSCLVIAHPSAVDKAQNENRLQQDWQKRLKDVVLNQLRNNWDGNKDVTTITYPGVSLPYKIIFNGQTLTCPTSPVWCSVQVKNSQTIPMLFDVRRDGNGIVAEVTSWREYQVAKRLRDQKAKSKL